MIVQESGPTRDVPGRLLRGGAVPGAAALAATSVVSLVVSGPAAAGSSLSGGLLALAAFAVGPLLMHVGRNLTPIGLQAAAMGAYLLVVIVLAIGYVLLDAAGWFRGLPGGIGVLVVSSAWLAGQLRGTVRLRTLTFGSDSDETAGRG